jgi:hypothetical protein
VYQILKENGIATPPHIVVSRDEHNNVVGDDFVEGEDYVQSGDTMVRTLLLSARRVDSATRCRGVTKRWRTLSGGCV